MIQGLNSGRGNRLISSAQPPDLLQGPPSLLFNGYQWFFPQG